MALCCASSLIETVLYQVLVHRLAGRASSSFSKRGTPDALTSAGSFMSMFSSCLDFLQGTQPPSGLCPRWANIRWWWTIDYPPSVRMTFATITFSLPLSDAPNSRFQSLTFGTNHKMRNLGLDILRLTAVVMVLVRHLHLPSTECAFLTIWQTGGWVGVDLFFVLSGFLVSGLLFKEFIRDQKINLKRFILRRGLKIYPAFYAFFLFTICVMLITNQSIAVRPLLGDALFLQNYLGSVWGHTWSLAVEEHFYIGIALLCLFATRTPISAKKSKNPFRFIPILFCSISLFCLLIRISNLFIFKTYSHEAFLFRTHLRIDSLMFGVLISYFWHFHNLRSTIQKFDSFLLLMIGFLLLSPAFLFPLEQYKFVSVFGVVLFYIGSGSMMLAALRLKESQSRLMTLLGGLGASSYSIYLWHMPWGTWGWLAFKKVTGLDAYLWYLVFYMVGSLGFGWVMSKIIEWPVLKFRDRLFPDNGDKQETGLDGSDKITPFTPRPSGMRLHSGRFQSD